MLALVFKTYLLGFLILVSAAGQKPQITALRIEMAPVIDGKLDEAVWRQGEVGSDFLQYEPDEGDPMTERTEFRILYTPSHLYLGIWCHDRSPDEIIARRVGRGGIFNDDYMYMALDPLRDRRNGYVFAFNSNASRYDALVSDNTNIDAWWDGIWKVRCTRDAEGWKAEVAIPFRTMNYNPDISTWGFNIGRGIRRKNETGRWTSAHPQFRTHTMAEAGSITGLEGLKDQLGLELSPYLTGRYRDTGDNESLLGDVGGDLRYRITPGLNATLSINTDFAETEVDRRQLNFGRFPLLFPEKRAFFLDDKSAFNFGNTFNRNYGFSSGLLPYFSRRIGLDEDGAPAPIRAATKVAGQVGDTGIGLLHAVVDDNGDTRNLMVARLRQNVLDQSSVGLIATYGDPASDEETFLVGPDVRYRTSSLFGDKIFEAEAFGLVDVDSGPTSNTETAWGFVASYPNDLWFASLKLIQVNEGFDPALGFVRRDGIRGYATNLSYEPRPDTPWLRQYKMSAITEHITDLNDNLESATYRVWPLNFEFESGDSIDISVTRQFDSPDEAFDVLQQIEVPAGDYWWTGGEIDFGTARKRALRGELELGYSQYYGGERKNVEAELGIHPLPRISTDLEYRYTDIKLNGDTVDTHNVGLRLSLALHPELVWAQFIQYDTISELIGWQGRLRWELEPGRDLFVVLQHNISEAGDSLVSESFESAVKLGATFWF